MVKYISKFSDKSTHKKFKEISKRKKNGRKVYQVGFFSSMNVKTCSIVQGNKAVIMSIWETFKMFDRFIQYC